MAVKTIQLDTMEPDDPHFRRQLIANDITMKVITDSGPNGFPLVEYTGEYEQLLKLVALSFTDDAEEAQEVVDDYLAWAADNEVCPGCGCRPGDGLTASCNDPAGCGFWRAAGQADRTETTPAFNSVAAHANAYWH